jgi:hypothetical protein
LKKMQEIVEASIERKAQKEAMDVPGGWIWIEEVCLKICLQVAELDL